MAKARNEVRYGVIGLGVMGGLHARHLREGRIPRARLAAVCDMDVGRAAAGAGPGIRACAEPRELLAGNDLDAVIVCVPHPLHTAIGLAAFRAGRHLLMEKPIASEIGDARRLVQAHRNKKLVFGVMFNQRTDPRYRKVRDLIRAGHLGPLQRVQWTLTDWFRTEAYYQSSGWRATWRGEGGGVLINQAPHQLDLYQWLVGMPGRVRAHCHFGKYHRIEVEDEVTAYLEHPGGLTGVFVISTGESPGLNRLEIWGNRGRVTVEGDDVRLAWNTVPARRYSRTSSEWFRGPDVRHQSLTVKARGGQHVEILRNFTDAVLDGAPLLAPGRDGLASLELANAMLYSSLREQTVTLPLSARAYHQALQKLKRSSARRT
jgi:predicted dehydrogenase